MVPQSWILHRLKMYKISDQIVVYCEDNANLENGIDRRRTKLSRGKDPKSIFQRYALSPLLFVIAMMPLNHILRKRTAGYKHRKIAGKDQPIDVHGQHQIFAKNEKELETLIQTVRIYSQYIVMEFGIEKCAMLVMKSGKRLMTEVVELPNEVIRTFGEKETYKYWGLLEDDTIKQQ